jgi:hypothetical protein
MRQQIPCEANRTPISTAIWNPVPGTQPLKVTISHIYGVVAIPHPLFPLIMEADRIEWRRELSAALWSSLVGSRRLS